MSQYKTHTYFNIFLALPISIVFIYYKLHTAKEFIITFSALFCYSTLFMSPDVDISDKIKLFSLKGLFTLPFRLYSKIFSHRGLSHSIIFGTATRILFLAALLSLLLFIFGAALPEKRSILYFFKTYKPYIIWGCLGIFFADICHLVLDYK